jgi:YD repeat-containing protein
MRVVLILICSLCCNVCLYSQSTFNPPDVIPRSPEASNLGRYGEIQVGEYTGTPDISIPLHTITSGKIKYPLALQYNATGIKVNQEATWVGLGWDMSASGIAYIPVGGNDKTDNMVQPWADWDRLIRYTRTGQGGPTVGKEHIPWWTDCEKNAPTGFTPETPPNVIISAMGPLGAVDLYAVNSPSFSFKFYLHRATGKPTVYGDKNNFEIEKVDNTGFVITDGDGVKYSFMVKEFTDELREDTNWYLTEIRSPDGSFLLFKYQNVGVTRTIPTLSENDFYGGNFEIAKELGYVDKHIYSSPSIRNLYLSEIESLTETVKFHLGGGREDLSGNGVRKLDSISVYDKFSNYKKTFIFEYGYFQSSSEDGYLVPGSSGFTAKHLGKRLKLLSLIEKNSKSGNKRYSFNYDEQKPLPYKTSYSIDHWGNYNGATNNTLVPTLYSILLFDKTGKSLFQGANMNAGAKRGADKDYITSSMLKSIVYPTGGRTEFTFEPHSFKNYTILSSNDENSPLTLIEIYDLNYPNGSGNPYTEASFELSTDREVTFNVNFNNKDGAFTYSQLGATMNLISINPNHVGLVKAWRPTQFVDGQNYSESFSEKILLPAGKYYVKINVNDDLGFQGYNMLAHASINYVRNQLSESALSSYESIGSGVRIKGIKNFDSDGSLLSSREYQYENSDGTSSGKLMNLPHYTDYRGLKMVKEPDNCSWDFTTIALINSNSASVLSTSPIKATVGYSRVSILDKDYSGSAGNGKIVKTFANDTGLGYFFGSVIMSENMIGNGEVLSIEYRDGIDDVVKVDSFKYETKILERDWINAKVQKSYVGIVPCGSTQGFDDVQNGCDQEGGYYIGVYPYINFKRVLKSKIDVIYSSGESLQSKSTYEYNMNNFAVSEEKILNSEGELITNQHKYPHDFSSGDNIYKKMVDANIVNPVVAEIKLKNDGLLEKSMTNYSLVDHLFIEPVAIERQVQSNPSETLLTFEKYNGLGNISQYRVQNGIYTSFIWGHDQTLPICRVDNAKLSDIFYTGFEDADGNSINGDSKTGLKSRAGGYTKVLAGLTNQKYIFTYWLKSGNTWGLKTSSVGVSAGSYKIDIPSSDQVDDIRFFPASAQMTSYTYIPTIGMTSSTDTNNVVSYYEYDSLGRLTLVRDANGKIVKQYKYHYNR